MKPDSPASAPEITKARNTTRGALIPAICAASGLEPTARNLRAARSRDKAKPTTMQAESASTTVTRTSTAPMENRLFCGRSTSQVGKLAVVMVAASEYSTRNVRNKARVPSVTMIEGTRP